MPKLRNFDLKGRSGAALLMTLGLSVNALLPLLSANPAQAQVQVAQSQLDQTRFTDVSTNHWASQFINSLAERNVIAGFPDGSFRPDQVVTRAQYAAMVRQAFTQANIRSTTTFSDIPAGYWATGAIDNAYQMGFLSGYPGGLFRPSQNIPRAQVLVSLANGLNYNATDIAATSFYQDAGVIPDYAVSSIAAATEQQLVVNYPDVQQLEPNRAATRAEVAAFIYQALSSQNQVAVVNSPYIVARPSTATALPAGTALPVTYANADKVVLLPEEVVPLTLTVKQSLVTQAGQVLVPAGSQVMGQLQPNGNGSQFVAQEILLASGQRLALNAASQVITERETIRRGASAGELLAGAVLGSSAATAIASVTGDEEVGTLEVLAGTVVGTVASVFLGRDRVEVIAIAPDTDLTLTLSESLTLTDD